ncbi:MAG: epoxyqueuosine reductase QueH, partial [Nitrospirae bacterium]|nr:epoxyqueuosine reductase QueH [Nitrospirota bacterium]
MKILLHICCANCAVYPVKILHEERHKFTGFWFNPNIQPHEEYKLRLESVKWLAGKWELDMIYADEAIKNPAPHPGESGEFSNENLQIPERPDRCRACYRLRLEKTAQEAQHWGYEAFSTTLLISPYQY